MGNPWKVEIELSYRRHRDRDERESKTREKGPRTSSEEWREWVEKKWERVKSATPTRKGGEGEGGGREMRENKIYPGHWRDFVSYILFEPIGFIYAGGRGLERARGCTWQNIARPVKEFPSFAISPPPPRPFAVRTSYFIVYLIPCCLSPSCFSVLCADLNRYFSGKGIAVNTYKRDREELL